MTYVYPTASNVAVFLNDYHVDQLFRIDTKESTPKYPIYGYNDRHYRKVQPGKTLIRGMLVLNYVYAGYLLTAIDYNPNKDKQLYNYGFYGGGDRTTYKEVLEGNLKDTLLTELPPNDSEDSRAARAEYIASLLYPKQEQSTDSFTDLIRPNNRNKPSQELETDKRLATKDALVNFMLEDPEHRIQRNIDRHPNEPSPGEQDIGQSVLDVYYEDPEHALWYVRYFDVSITDVSQQISQAGNEGSAEPLYEIYQFISSHRLIKHVTSKLPR